MCLIRSHRAKAEPLGAASNKACRLSCNVGVLSECVCVYCVGALGMDRRQAQPSLPVSLSA